MRIYEYELVPHVARYLRNKGYLVFTEKYVGIRRADVIGVLLNEEEVKKRIEHNTPRIPIRIFLRIMRVLEQRGDMSIKELAATLGYSTSYIRKVVATANPIFLVKQRGVIKKVRDYKPYTHEILGVEVKVNDWRNGLVQADWYLYALHKAYLAIYEKAYKRIPEKVIEWAQDRGIGILTISKNGAVEEKVAAKTAGPKSKSAYYVLAESLWEKVFETLTHSNSNLRMEGEYD